MKRKDLKKLAKAKGLYWLDQSVETRPNGTRYPIYEFSATKTLQSMGYEHTPAPKRRRQSL